MKYAILKNGKVENIIVWDGVSSIAYSEYLVPLTKELEDSFNQEEVIDLNKSVRPMYFRLSLDSFGLLDDIIAALEDPSMKRNKISFEYALEFKRTDSMIVDFAVAFGLSNETVDAIFSKALELQSEG